MLYDLVEFNQSNFDFKSMDNSRMDHARQNIHKKLMRNSDQSSANFRWQKNLNSNRCLEFEVKFEHELLRFMIATNEILTNKKKILEDAQGEKV